MNVLNHSAGYETLFHAVNNRITIDLAWLDTGHEAKDDLELLARHDIKPIQVNIVELAKSRLSSSIYKLRSLPIDAPDEVDCAAFTQWVYRQLGIPLSRHTVSQFLDSVKVCPPPTLKPEALQIGDLIFVKGRKPWTLNGRVNGGPGHVGLYIGDGQAVHAANKTDKMLQQSLDKFLEKYGPDNFRGVGRYLPPDANLITLESPPELMLSGIRDIHCYIFAREPAIGPR